MQGEKIEIEQIISRARYLHERNDYLVVEGIGGWQVPLAA